MIDIVCLGSEMDQSQRNEIVERHPVEVKPTPPQWGMGIKAMFLNSYIVAWL